MGKIYQNQSALTLQVRTGVDITGALAHRIYYRKPDDTSAYWTATPLTVSTGVIKYDFTGSELDTVGTWTVWAYIQFSDSRIGYGETGTFNVYEVGT